MLRLPLPQPLGLTKTFGFGDRLGVATPGHFAAARKFSFAPIFAQQSLREIERTRRTPTEVIAAAQDALADAGSKIRWGADAEGLRTEADATRAVAAGFSHFTIDATAWIEERADRMSTRELEEAVAAIVNEGVLSADWTTLLGQSSAELAVAVQPSGGAPDRTSLLRAGVKFARALHHVQRIARVITAHSHATRCELEFAIADNRSATSPLEHLFCGLELRRRGVGIVSFAPRFGDGFEAGVDFTDDVGAFAAELDRHVTIARHCGPYKISFHRGSDKFALYPTIGRVCGDLLHLKTNGTSYLEALRVVCRTAPGLFREIATFARGRFESDRKSAVVSTTSPAIDRLFKTAIGPRADENLLHESAGRQLFHVTAGSVLGVGATAKGRPFKEAILEVLAERADLHRELLDAHFTRHLTLLNSGCRVHRGERGNC